MRRFGAMVVVTSALVLGGCTVDATPDGIHLGEGSVDVDGVQPAGDPSTVATDLEAPWSMVRLGSGSTLISERDTGRVKELTEDGETRVVGTVPGVDAGGEGGLLGLAVASGDPTYLYAYFTSATDNEIARIELLGEAGGYELGASGTILAGLEKANNHNGGRIAFGPDGMLYATVGDAGEPPNAQDLDSLNGKILRMTPTGAVPDDNPFDDSLVYSLGHRNPQGLAWDDTGQLWASEFGQDTWDELNRIEPGANYGWPDVEGIAASNETNDDEADVDFVDPVYQWTTDEASPSGLAVIDGTLFMASLKGERVWAIYTGTIRGGTDDGEEQVDAVPWFTGEFGRIRDVIEGPDGTLWFLTNNTDGRGAPREGDDTLIEVRLTELVEG